MDEKRHKTPGVYISHGKEMEPENEPYYKLMEKGRNLGPKIAVILRAVKEIFYKRTPMEKITLDKLAGACEYYLAEDRATTNMIPYISEAPAVPAPVTVKPEPKPSTGPESVERNMNLDNEGLRSDLEKIPEKDMSFLFGSN